MKRNIILIISLPLLLVFMRGNTQNITKNFLNKEPMKNCFVLSENSVSANIDKRRYVTVLSKNDSVFSISQGQIENIYRQDESAYIVVKHNDSLFVYGGLKGINKQLKEKINLGAYLGKASQKKEGYESILFGIRVSGSFLTFNKLVSYMTEGKNLKQ